MTFGLTSLVFLGEGAPGLETPIASSSRSNSAYKLVHGQHSLESQDIPLQLSHLSLLYAPGQSYPRPSP
jgi:hypothetical protein